MKLKNHPPCVLIKIAYPLQLKSVANILTVFQFQPYFSRILISRKLITPFDDSYNRNPPHRSLVPHIQPYESYINEPFPCLYIVSV